MLYLSLKTIHIISATLLFGTGIGSAYYLLRAHLSRNPEAITITVRHVVTADWLFTATSGVVQLVTGLWMVWLAGWSLGQIWLWLSLGLFILAGACWLPVVWLQIRMRDTAVDALATGSPLPALYHRYMRIWFILGWPAFMALVLVFFLMVFKPH